MNGGLRLTVEVETETVQSATPIMKSVPPHKSMIEIINQQKELLEQEYNTKKAIITGTDDLGKLKMIATAFQKIRQLEISRPLTIIGRVLPDYFLISTQNGPFVVGFLHAGGAFASRIKNFNELVTKHQDTYFKLLRDGRLEVKGKIGRSEIGKLNNATNGEFVFMDKEDRITFELIYKLIIDIQNKDLEFELEDALNTLESHLNHYWLIKIFTKATPI